MVIQSLATCKQIKEFTARNYFIADPSKENNPSITETALVPRITAIILPLFASLDTLGNTLLFPTKLTPSRFSKSKQHLIKVARSFQQVIAHTLLLLPRMICPSLDYHREIQSAINAQNIAAQQAQKEKLEKVDEQLQDLEAFKACKEKDQSSPSKAKKWWFTAEKGKTSWAQYFNSQLGSTWTSEIEKEQQQLQNIKDLLNLLSHKLFSKKLSEIHEEDVQNLQDSLLKEKKQLTDLLQCSDASQTYDEETGPADAKGQLLHKIATCVHPRMEVLFKSLFDFEETKDCIESWSCDKKGNFTLQLKKDVRLWIAPQEAGDEEIEDDEPQPVGGTVLLLDKKIQGTINIARKSIRFDQGFDVYLKHHRLGKITAQIQTLGFEEKEDLVQFKAGKTIARWQLGETKARKASQILKSWSRAQIIKEGTDYAEFLQKKIEAYQIPA